LNPPNSDVYIDVGLRRKLESTFKLGL